MFAFIQNLRRAVSLPILLSPALLLVAASAVAGGADEIVPRSIPNFPSRSLRQPCSWCVRALIANSTPGRIERCRRVKLTELVASVAVRPACSALDEDACSANDRDPSMDAAVALLAFVTLQRFVEFIWDRRNTRRLRAAGAVEFGGLHYPAMMLVHAGWLAGLWLLAYDSPVIPGYRRRLSGAAGRPLLGARDPGPALDDPRHRAARRAPDRKRSIPPAAASELRDRSGRAGAGAIGARAPLYALVSVVLYAGAALLRVQVENSALAWVPGERAGNGVQSTRY